MNARIAVAWIMAAGAIACASPHAPERSDPPLGPPAPIRAFDIATIEALAQQMYAQDRFAATASDVLLAKVSEKMAAREGVKHWITGTRDGHHLVRFIRIGDRGPEVGYDVAFAGLADPTVSVPADRSLTPDELSQYHARMIALENLGGRCSDSYNTIALRDPDADGWLVWALAASLDPKAILIGGHYRFTITTDGKAIRSRDALSTTCLRFEKRSESAGDFMSHVISLTPVETHAFASLTHGKTFHVGTNDGRAWRVDAGRIVRIEQDSPGADGFAARALAAIDEKCTLITSKKDDPAKRHETTDDIKVIETTEDKEAFSVTTPPGTESGMIVCLRRDIVPSPNDYKVGVAGYPLMISDRGTGHAKRNGILGFSKGKFEFWIAAGEPLTDELTKRVNDRLEAFQRAIATAR